MTTIAFDGRILAVDRAGWIGNGIQYETDKLYEFNATPQGLPIMRGYYAAAGNAGDAVAIARWLQGKDMAPPALVDRDSGKGLIVTNEDPPRVFRLTSALTCDPVYTLPWGDGAGLEMAIGAMAAGKTAAQAVEIVARHSMWAAIGMDYVDVVTGTHTRVMFR